jgi:hypothetical protein
MVRGAPGAMMAGTLGECRLCGEIRPLRNSHLMPRALYRYLAFPAANEYLAITEGKYTRTSRQITWLLPIAASLMFRLLAVRTRTEERYLIERFGDQYRAEQALGVPLTRVDLGEKVLYKYKDLTIEFHNGKVTDVR